jgi:protein gp37
MAEHSSIEWTEATWNPITGCSVVSPGCTNCYAMRLAGTRLAQHPSRAGLTRDSKAGPVWTGEVRFNKQWLDQPLRWKRPRMIFVCAHGDLFHESVPDEWIDKVFAIMALAPQHTFQVLTKRSRRMREYVNRDATKADIRNAAEAMFGADHFVWAKVLSAGFPLPNVWLGVSAEDQARADERIPDLLATPAAVRWLSAEPLLGPVNLDEIAIPRPELRASMMWSALREWGGAPAKLDWVVVGGESGPGARPMHPDWARSLRDQCAAAGVPFFFKQWGEFETHYDRDHDDPDWRQCGTVERLDSKGRWLNLAGGHGFHGDRVVRVSPVGKKRAGRLLDGVDHNGMPEALR